MASLSFLLAILTNVIILFLTTRAQDSYSTYPYPSSLICAPGAPLTEAPSCDFLNNATESCAGLADKLSQRECICIQRVFNAIFDCESELRICFESDRLDNEMVDVSSLWESLCATYITYTPTTPVLRQASTTYDDAFCGTIVSGACSLAEDALNSCSNIANPTSSTSCMCDSAILKYEYTCEYIGNFSCFATTAELTNLFGYSECANFGSVIGSGLAGPTTKTVSFTPTSTASPGSTTTTTPTSTKTSSAHGILLPISFISYLSLLLPFMHNLF